MAKRGMGCALHNFLQFGQHPQIQDLLQGDQLRANHRPSFPDEFVQSVGVLDFDGWVQHIKAKKEAFSTTDPESIWNTRLHTLEGPEPQEVEPVRALTLRNLCVVGPLQLDDHTKCSIWRNSISLDCRWDVSTERMLSFVINWIGLRQRSGESHKNGKRAGFGTGELVSVLWRTDREWMSQSTHHLWLEKKCTNRGVAERQLWVFFSGTATVPAWTQSNIRLDF